MSFMNIPQTDQLNAYPHRNSISSSTSSKSPSPLNQGWDSQEESPKNTTRKSTSTFISKLFNMTNDTCNQHLISWNINGTSFLVYNVPRFSQEVLPGYFKHSNFSSFVRQLNMYGFHKVNKTPRGQRTNNETEIWEFSHPKFQYNRPDLLEDIKRKVMDSELLRREAGDIHASFAMVQLSQAETLQQFRILQDNFNRLVQELEDMKKVQSQQQALIKKLIAQQDSSHMYEQFMKQDMISAGLYPGQTNPLALPARAIPPSPASSILLSSPPTCLEELNEPRLLDNRMSFNKEWRS
ncbi:HSF-type DNA-binding-domain-containing protein [Gilbertella persicaria]|uniref:HSF-type DNA-binding domain-containing protein n=1 Tax=Rhizopus stolonifer TaxID=4846 RepID=A0A367KTQ5_RHIST|nr:HSF-type DNA-binding-domain-containing protein [Gilbertella persicaria]KAI8084239.1 HSF-type DNA-binding-domain-containing protein [Gilbertella persicaria]RCI05579.1 hypothetical protein CU098_012429 [Rhizopus stolonifer]